LELIVDKSQQGSGKRYLFPIDPKGDPRLELVRGATRLIFLAAKAQVIVWEWEEGNYSVLHVTVDWKFKLRLAVYRVSVGCGRMIIIGKSKCEERLWHEEQYRAR
jgi:hypothetical protein